MIANESGGRHIVPVQSCTIFLHSAHHGDTHAIHALLALPFPPDVDAASGADKASLLGADGPQLGALRVIMDAGTDVSLDNNWLRKHAATAPACVGALSLRSDSMLLDHIPDGNKVVAAHAALDAACQTANTAAIGELVCASQPSSGRMHLLAMKAVVTSSPEFLVGLLSSCIRHVMWTPS